MPFLMSSLARRTVVFMLAGLAALLMIVGASIWLAGKTRDHAAEVVRAREIRTLSANILIELLDAETGQRGFMLTGERPYLEPYHEARIALGKDLNRLGILTIGAPTAGRLQQLIAALTQAKLAELGETIDLAENGRRDEAIAIVHTNDGKETMDNARKALSELIVASENRVASRLDDMSASADALSWASIAGGLLIVLFGGAAAWTVTRHTRELVAAQREIAVLNTGLEQRVAERTSALQRANDEIQRFAYIVSHDLRSPLVNIMGFTSEFEVGVSTVQQFLNAPEDGKNAEAAQMAAFEELPEAVRFVRASTGKMDNLINAILKLSREGRRELNPEPVDLGVLFGNAVASLKHQLGDAGAQIVLPAKFPSVVSDRLAIEQIFGNLIDNAVKYLKPGRPGEIAITADEVMGRVQITVTDNGRGVAPQDHERIFELFRRAGVQDRRGEGIGLAHVRALVRRMGGDVTLQSVLGEGSAFRVDLPKTLVVNDSYSQI